MKTIRGYRNLPQDARHCSVAIGNFDGVHRGHRAVIGQAKALSAQRDLPLAVLTFDPHPRRFFAPDSPPFLLTGPAEKARKLAALGVDVLCTVPFDAALAALSPAEFIDDVLVEGLGAQQVVVGSDFCFGARRAGNVTYLAERGSRSGFEVQPVSPQAGEDGATYSSSAVRAALREGRVADAAAILGEPHRYRGTVERGDQRGRTIGFPTANLSLDGLLPPLFGVYAVTVEIIGEATHRGVANIGMRPTFEKTVPILEVNLFDFAGDLYGKEIAVALDRFLRPERKFDGLDALKAQIAADAEAAQL